MGNHPGSIKYECLSCKSTRSTIKGKYGEVIVCELCNGAMVDKFYIYKYKAAAETKSKDKKPILMGSENHNDWKLEELLEQVEYEVAHKINKIIDDPSPQAQLVVRNNLAIIEHLGAAAVLQRSSGIVLDALRANGGPAGKPRIGRDKG
ncbi:hypothetical protein [Terribacillus saccharophilus]|uniref:hypothetical protein n=1 Tax=Terribacillus saccharophilus TaxID=361277 RepID=UPI002DC63BC1|nr:hypothetical protein [Terribacillus saccharophilus]MEC0288820.1 hypothetical protein [Terribacillus saccharophilus]